MTDRIPYTEASIVTYLLTCFPGEEPDLRTYVQTRFAELKENMKSKPLKDTISIETLKQWANGYRPRPKGRC